MGKPIDETGNRYGRLTVIRQDGCTEKKLLKWLCRCDCGAERSIIGYSLRRGATRSCGCLTNVTKTEYHGRAGDSVYRVWSAMIQRCSNPAVESYRYYGAIGINVCDRWRKSFCAFLEDMGEKPDGTSIERIDGSKDYTPDNCKWASILEQNRNKSDVKLNEVAALVIRYMHAKGRSQASIARAHNVSSTCIHSVISGRTWKENLKGESK